MEKATEVYTGPFEDDKYEGQGHLVKKDQGFEFDGEFSKGIMHGKGTYTFLDSECILTGTWKNGIKVGLFTVKYPDQVIAFREYENDKIVNGNISTVHYSLY